MGICSLFVYPLNQTFFVNRNELHVWAFILVQTFCTKESIRLFVLVAIKDSFGGIDRVKGMEATKSMLALHFLKMDNKILKLYVDILEYWVLKLR